MAATSIITGQYVTLQQTAASVSDRILAQLIDWAIIIMYLGFEILSMIYLDPFDSLDENLAWILVFCLSIPPVFYHPICEMLNKGQSVGKMVMQCRVVMVDGSTPTIGSYMLRWLLYPVDVLLTGGLGLVFILFSKHNQRMGDMAAGTMVIKLINYQNMRINLNDYHYIQQNYRPTYNDAADLSLKQVDLIIKVLYHTKENREARIYRLAQNVCEYLNLPQTPSPTSSSIPFSTITIIAHPRWRFSPYSSPHVVRVPVGRGKMCSYIRIGCPPIWLPHLPSSCLLPALKCPVCFHDSPQRTSHF